MKRFFLLLLSASALCACTDDPAILAPNSVDGPNNTNGEPHNVSTNGTPNNGGTTGAWNPGTGWISGPFAGGAPLPPANLAVTPQTFDVVIFGAGTGGTAAALQAARMGASVALVEETDWVGGQATASGVSTMDEGGFNNDAGIYGEFLAAAEAHYATAGKRIRQCGIRGIPCTEPQVGQLLLRRKLSEAAVTLFERSRPVAGRVETGRLVRVQAYQRNPSRILEFTGTVFIDATEYGDLLPLAGVDYRLGQSTSDALDATDCVQDITVAPIIRRYDQVPAELTFTNPPPGYGPAVEQKFAETVVATGGIDWEAQGWGAGYPTDWKTHVSYRATPDSARAGDSVVGDFDTITRTGVNWANDYPYSVADIETRRFEANCEAKLHTLQFLYYVQNVMGVPQWAVANDEGYDSPHNIQDNDCPGIGAEFDAIERHLNPLPYIREARRMVGVYTLKGSDIERRGGRTASLTRFATSIAVGDYAMDLHSCHSAADFESGLESAADLPEGFVGGPFQIPMEVLIPASLDGLLAAEKNISQSRLVNGATRLQPSTMATGQAAGALAALAVQRGEMLRDVAPALVQDVLARAGARLGVTKFADVPQSNPFWSDVEFVSGRGILIGKEDGTFGASDALTRGQAALYLARLFDLNVSNPPQTPSFGDVPTSHFAYAAIEAVRTAGITAGCGDGSNFCPDDALTRAQMATLLARGLGFSGAAPQGPTFADVDAGNVHYDNIEYLYSLGIVTGCRTGAYCPTDPLTRRQAAVLAHRLIVWDVDN